MININFIRLVLFILAGMFFIIGIWFFFLAKVKKIIIPKIKTENYIHPSIKLDENKSLKFDCEDVTFGKYKLSDIIKTIDTFTYNFNKVNKFTNIASGIVSIISSFSLILSGLLVMH